MNDVMRTAASYLVSGGGVRPLPLAALPCGLDRSHFAPSLSYLHDVSDHFFIPASAGPAR